MSIRLRIPEWWRRLRPWGLASMPYTPNSTAVSQILGKIDAMLAQIGDRAAHATRINQLTATLTTLKTPQTGQIAALPIKDGAVDAAEWAKKSKTDQCSTWAILTEIHKELRCMHASALRYGEICCGISAALLIAIALVYLSLHQPAFLAYLQRTLPEQEAPHKVVTALEHAHFIELKLSSLKEKQARKLSEKPSAPAPASGDNIAQSTSPSLDQDIETNQKAIYDKWKDFKQTLNTMPLPYETRHLLGTASAELEAGDTTIHVTFQSLIKHLQADLESLSTAYFWTIPPWRWVEISLWATMGCLVGLLFYIAGLLKQGVFYPEEIPMFGAELLMAPIVVPVIFFLFNMSGISGFTPSQSSITMNIGMAFILGFAIRRTIGIIDLIKKRILPDPASS